MQEESGRFKTKKMFWAVFGYGIRSQLVPMDGDLESAKGGVTAQVYKDVLANYLP